MSSGWSAPPHPGDIVHYAITIADTGQTAYAGATVTDSLTGVLDDATFDNDATATGVGTVSFAAPDLTWTGDLSPGATVTVTYSVSVNDPATGTSRSPTPSAPPTPAETACPEALTRSAHV
jgi:hypothetical protein